MPTKKPQAKRKPREPMAIYSLNLPAPLRETFAAIDKSNSKAARLLIEYALNHGALAALATNATQQQATAPAIPDAFADWDTPPQNGDERRN